jgi:hypothetical protein
MEYLAALAPLLAAMMGEAAARGDVEEAERLRQEAMAQYNIELPPAQQIVAEFQQSQAATAHEPAAQSSRLDVLRQLSERAGEGYNAEDRAAINNSLSDVTQRERGQRMAIEQNLDPNSGEALAAKLSNQQAGAQRANQQGLEIAGQSRANAMRALMAQGQLSGQMEDDAFKRGQASDAMAQFNERNRIGAQQWNANQGQQRFDNQMGLANAKSGGQLGMSDYLTGRGERTKQRAGQIGKGVQTSLIGASKASSSSEQRYDANGDPIYSDPDEWENPYK